MKVSEMEVQYISHMGSDDSVANAARVSFHKDASQFTKEQNVKLLHYLARNNHWSPYAHAFASFRIKAPIFVARQLVKHQVGLAWNEVSRRYVDEEPEFWFPKEWRGRPVNAKQGSSGVVDSIWWIPGDSWYPVNDGVKEATHYALKKYLRMIKEGVAPEQARMILPQNTMTEWIWSGSLAAFCRVCKLRLDPHAQLETQELVGGIKALLEPLFPVSFAALTENQ